LRFRAQPPRHPLAATVDDSRADQGEILISGIPRSGFQRRCRRCVFAQLAEHRLQGAIEHRLARNKECQSTIEQIVDVPALAEFPVAERDEFARRYFEHLWKLGHVMIALP